MRIDVRMSRFIGARGHALLNDAEARCLD
jgi:hypothetical protein